MNSLVALLAVVAFGLPGAASGQGAGQPPVLEFPEPGLDDPQVYRDYRTRFYRDAHGNAFQVYLRRGEGRVVHLLANAANESVGFTVRDAAGRPAPLDWASAGAAAARAGRAHSVTYRLATGGAPVVFGWFLLGSMRVERDFQYAGRHLEPFDAPPFRIRELVELVGNLGRLGPAERRRHLAALGARSVEELRGRLDPTIMLSRSDTAWVVLVTQPSFDGKHRLSLELRVPAEAADVTVRGRTVVVRPRGGGTAVAVRVTTDAAPLTPIGRDRIFNADFRAFAERVRAGGDGLAARRLERQIRGVELASYQEKLLAGLPNFATYFGRDMMVTSLLMEPVWDPAMLEHVIASVLRKLSPDGRVSHEEALGGQAIREGAAEYNALVRRALGPGGGARADTLLARARAVLADLQRVRENYRMVDDDFQLPVVAARYLANPRVPADRKRAFLGDTTLARLLRNLAYVAEAAGPYADRPEALNLVGFPPADGERWYSGSWRDSGPGYANGRFAMDVNAIWVPEALAGIARIFAALEALGYEPARLERAAPWLRGGRLGAWVRDSAALARAIATWRGAVRHFLVRLAPAEVTARVQAKLASLPEPERAYWLEVWRRHETPGDTLEFLGLSLDRRGQPIPVMNSDPAMRLLLQDVDEVEARRALRPFLLRYPVGLLVDGLGPLVANDAYAPPAVWEPWRTDLYHSPRVVWGREVNILSMALARAPDRPGFREALAATRRAVEVSGLGHAELWTYGVEGGRLVPRRYGASSDVQLWNLTDLAVEFALARLGAP